MTIKLSPRVMQVGGTTYLQFPTLDALVRTQVALQQRGITVKHSTSSEWVFPTGCCELAIPDLPKAILLYLVAKDLVAHI